MDWDVFRASPAGLLQTPPPDVEMIDDPHRPMASPQKNRLVGYWCCSNHNIILLNSEIIVIHVESCQELGLIYIYLCYIDLYSHFLVMVLRIEFGPGGDREMVKDLLPESLTAGWTSWTTRTTLCL